MPDKREVTEIACGIITAMILAHDPRCQNSREMVKYAMDTAKEIIKEREENARTQYSTKGVS